MEPEESNITMMKENISPYPHIKYLECGLWNNNKWPNIKDIGLGEWGFMVEESDSRDPEAIRAVTVGEILKSSGYEEIDILNPPEHHFAST